MKIYHLGVEEALASLNNGPAGLSAAEAQRRLREFGPNRVEAVAQESLWLSLFFDVTLRSWRLAPRPKGLVFRRRASSLCSE